MTKEQSKVLAAWYFAVIRDVRERQNNRQKQINALEKELAESDLDDKTRKSKTKELQDKNLLDKLDLSNREMQDEKGKKYLMIYADDILNIYQHFKDKDNGYSSEKDWKDLIYQLKLSLYTRFPELVRKQKSTSDK